MTRNLAVALPLSRKLGCWAVLDFMSWLVNAIRGLFMWKDPEFSCDVGVLACKLSCSSRI